MGHLARTCKNKNTVEIQKNNVYEYLMHILLRIMVKTDKDNVILGIPDHLKIISKTK